MQVTWQPRRWAWIDPSADVTAAEKSKNNMLTSAGAIIREQGKDPQTVWAEIARDTRAMIDELGHKVLSKKLLKK
jgi:capsid protein